MSAPAGKPPSGANVHKDPQQKPIGAIESLQLTYAAHLDQRRRRVEGRRGRSWWEWKAAEQRKLASGDEGDDELTSLESDTLGKRTGSLPSIRENLCEVTGGSVPLAGGISKGLGGIAHSGSSPVVPRVTCGVRVLPPYQAQPSTPTDPVQRVTIKSFQQPAPSQLSSSQSSLAVGCVTPQPSPTRGVDSPQPTAPPKDQIYSEIVNESGPIYLTLGQEYSINENGTKNQNTSQWKPLKLEIGQYTHQYSPPEQEYVRSVTQAQVNNINQNYEPATLTVEEREQIKLQQVSSTVPSSANSRECLVVQQHKLYPEVADKKFLQSDTDEEALISEKQRVQLEYYQQEKQRKENLTSRSASTGDLKQTAYNNPHQINQQSPVYQQQKSDYQQSAYYQQYQQDLEQKQRLQQQQQEQYKKQTQEYQQQYQQQSKHFQEQASQYQHQLQQQQQEKRLQPQVHQQGLRTQQLKSGTESASCSPARDLGSTGGGPGNTRAASLPPNSSLGPNKKPGGAKGPAGRGSGSLVWVNQPGGGAKLEWVPTKKLSTLKTVPGSPTLGSKGRASIQEPRNIGGGVAGVGSDQKYESDRDKNGGVEGGGGYMGKGGGYDSREARADAVTRVGVSDSARVDGGGGCGSAVSAVHLLDHSVTSGDSSSSLPALVHHNTSYQCYPSPGVQSKNAFSSAPDSVRSEGRSALSDVDVNSPSKGAVKKTGCIKEKRTTEEGAEEEGRVVTVAGKHVGQVVRIRVRPEVHAYLQNLPITSSHLPQWDLRRDSIHSGNSSSISAITGGSEGGGEGSDGYQEDNYGEVVDEYSLLRRAVDDHDPQALQLLAAAEAVLDPDIPSRPHESGQFYDN